MDNDVSTYMQRIARACPIYDENRRVLDAAYDSKCEIDHNLLLDATDYTCRKAKYLAGEADPDADLMIDQIDAVAAYHPSFVNVR
jgi:hypothetical protein